MKKYIKIISLIVIALIFIGTFVFLYQKSQPKDTVYDILHPQTTDLAQITVATGKIEPRDEVQIKPQISGIISEVYKEAGETVKKGEIIAKVKVIPELGSLNLPKAVYAWPKSMAVRLKPTWNVWRIFTKTSW